MKARLIAVPARFPTPAVPKTRSRSSFTAREFPMTMEKS